MSPSGWNNQWSPIGPSRVPGRNTGNVGDRRKFRGSEAHWDQDLPTSVARGTPSTARRKVLSHSHMRTYVESAGDGTLGNDLEQTYGKIYETYGTIIEHHR